MTKPPISVPTESRPTPLDTFLGSDLSGRSLPELLNLAAQMLTERGDGPVADCLRDKAYQAEAALVDAASSSLLPVGRQPQMDDVMRYLESENFGDIATDHKDGADFCISDAILSFVRFWETRASLPAGESTREKCDMCSQPLDAQVEFLNRELANFRRNAAFAAQKSVNWGLSSWRVNGQGPVPSVPAEIESHCQNVDPLRFLLDTVKEFYKHLPDGEYAGLGNVRAAIKEADKLLADSTRTQGEALNESM